MADEKKVLSSLLEAILQMELPKEVYAGFAREMMTRAGLSLDDCFPADQTALFLKNVRNKCDELFRLTESSPFSAAAAEILPSASEKTETEEMPLEDENGIVGYVLGAGEKKGGASAAEETPLPSPVKVTAATAKSWGGRANERRLKTKTPPFRNRRKRKRKASFPYRRKRRRKRCPVRKNRRGRKAAEILQSKTRRLTKTVLPRRKGKKSKS